MDLQQLLAAAQQMQDHLMSAQQELADAEVEGTSGGGLVKARVNGQGELVELTISPAASRACPRFPACPGSSAARPKHPVPKNPVPANQVRASWAPGGPAGSRGRPHHDDMRD